MWEKDYENMTDEELKNHIKKIEEIQKKRKDKTRQEALKKVKEIIEDYHNQGIDFYIPDGYGDGYDIVSNHIHVKTWW